MLYKCVGDLVPDTSLDYTPFDPGVKTAEPFVKENTNPVR